MKKIIFLLIPLIFIGCSPKYKVEKSYVYPQGKTVASSCFKNCKKELKKCQDENQLRYDKCMDAANKRAEEIYKRNFIQYKHDFKIYKRNLELYEERQNYYRAKLNEYDRYEDYFYQRCLKDDNFACEQLSDVKIKKAKLRNKSSVKPKSPKEPDLNEIYKTQALNCTKGDFCDIEYDSCFKGCGGEILVERICIENCD